MNVHELINSWFYLSHETRPSGVLRSNIHSHHSYEMFIIVNGSTTMLLDNNFVSVSKGDIILLEPDVLHKNNGGTRHNRYAIHFTPEYLRTYFSDRTIEYLLDIFQNNKLTVEQDTFNDVLKILRRAESDEEHAYIHIAEIISLLNNNENVIRSRTVYANLTVNNITEYIHSNYADITGLDDIADSLHITKPYMCHIFKKETDITVSDYLNNVRIHNACELLRNGSTNITETAMQCGYNSPMYFCRVFKKLMKMTPNAYKSSIGTSKV